MNDVRYCDRHQLAGEPSPMLFRREDGTWVCVRCGPRFPKVRDGEGRVGDLLQREFDR